MAEVLTAERLREVLSYDAETGEFLWVAKTSKFGNVEVGTLAGGLMGIGYVAISIDKHSYLAHRLAWLWVHGEFPTGVIDHRNGIRSDNRIDNLRDVSRQINSQNRRVAKAATGLMGAFLHKPSGRFFSSIRTADRKVEHLGYFGTAQQAHEAYVAAKRRLHEGCTL